MARPGLLFDTVLTDEFGNGNEIQATFSWTPDNSAVRTAPYITVFRISEQMFYFAETIQFEVASVTGIHEVNNNNKFNGKNHTHRIEMILKN